MINFLEKSDLSGYTLLIPSVSVGNVGQLAIDLIISSLSMKKIGTLWDPSIIPIIGPPAYQHDEALTTASDLYISKLHKLIILQIRSPVVAALMGALFEKLTDFILKENIEKLIILTGSFSHEKHVGDNPIQYSANSSFCDKFKHSLDDNELPQFQGQLIHGGGYANNLKTIATQKNIPTLVLFKYVSEGDNTPDAIQLTEYLNKILNALPKQDNGQIKLVVPLSWKYLYGNETPQTIY